jgi:uncharacterized membrane protein
MTWQDVLEAAVLRSPGAGVPGVEGRRLVQVLPRDPAGLCGAALLWLSGLSPSLLPRPIAVAWGLSGLLAALGYGLGCTVGWAVRAVLRRPPRRPERVARWLAVALWCAAIAMTVVATQWQREQLAGLGMPPTPPSWWAVAGGGVLVAWLLLLLARALRALARRTSAVLRRRAGHGLATTAGVLVAAGVAVAVLAVGYAATWVVFDRIDASGSGRAAPVSTLRSGGPGSRVPFATLGAEGQRFVVGGPSVATISRYAGRPALDPVRVFVGLASAPDPRARARLAVQELVRTGALERRLVVVATTTGNGFLDPNLVAGPELLEGGDVATVSMQYSVLPSWLSFLVDRSAAQEAGTALLAAVEDAVRDLPQDRRPMLAVTGESLGAFGSQSPFAGMDPTQVASRVDAAVWVGTPGATELWSTWRDTRSSGPVWQPVIGDSTVARNPATADSVLWTAPGWGPRRLVLTQHADDPVSWWSPDLLWSDPEWLDVPRGPGVDDRMTWWPLVLFLQTGLDLATAGSVPPGVGHDYADVSGPAWAYALDCRGVGGGEWRDSDTARLRAALAS